VARATTGEWGRYYESAEQKRRLHGGDPFRRYIERHTRRERRLLLGSSLFLTALVTTFCVVLMH
jgi:hypothetical protein